MAMVSYLFAWLKFGGDYDCASYVKSSKFACAEPDVVLRMDGANPECLGEGPVHHLIHSSHRALSNICVCSLALRLATV